MDRNFFFIYHFCWLSYLSKLAECWGSFAFIGFLQTFKVMHVGLRIFDNLRIISTFRVHLGEPWIQGTGTGSSSPYPLRGHGVCCFFFQHYIRSSQGTVDWMSRDLLPLLLHFIFFVFDKTITFGCISSPVQILWHCLRCFPLHGTMMLLFHLTQ
jgi:hypothetical protein